mgnify:CR=1 FL=1
MAYLNIRVEFLQAKAHSRDDTAHIINIPVSYRQ